MFNSWVNLARYAQATRGTFYAASMMANAGVPLSVALQALVKKGAYSC